MNSNAISVTIWHRRLQLLLLMLTFCWSQVLIAPCADESMGLQPGDVALMVRAGDGKVVTQRNASFTALATAQGMLSSADRADVALFSPDTKHTQARAKLCRTGIPCINPLFIVEWVTCPWKDVADAHDPDGELPEQLLRLMRQRSDAPTTV